MAKCDTVCIGKRARDSSLSKLGLNRIANSYYNNTASVGGMVVVNLLVPHRRGLTVEGRGERGAAVSPPPLLVSVNKAPHAHKD